MANKLIKLIENKELRDSMGKESKKNSYKFSKENISRQWFDFLERF